MIRGANMKKLMAGRQKKNEILLRKSVASTAEVKEILVMHEGQLI